MQNKKGAGSGLVIGLVLLIVLVAIVYLALNGDLSSLLSGSGQSTSNPSSFSTTASIQSSAVYAGHSTNILFQYYNPFNQPLTPTVTLNIGSPSFVSAVPTSKSVPMLADMPSPATVAFNVTCSANSANEVSTSTFDVNVPSVTQNLTTSVVTYPLGSSPLQEIYTNTNQGFFTLSAPPVAIETGTSASSTQPITLTFTDPYESGSAYSGTFSGSPNDNINSVTITVDNAAGGISSASVDYNGVQTPLTASGTTLTVTLTDVDLTLIPSGLVLDLTAAGLSTPTQNIISVSTAYNFYYSFNGPTVSCQ